MQAKIPCNLFISRMGEATSVSRGCPWNPNTWKYTWLQIHVTFKHITSKQFWHEEREHKNKRWDKPRPSPPPSFPPFFPFNWLTSMKSRMEEGINRLRPFTPTSHFLVSIEYQFRSNPRENVRRMSPITSLRDINAPAHTANGMKGTVCTSVRLWLHEWGGEI